MDASELLKKYREGKCTTEELALLETWYATYHEQPLEQLDEQKQEQELLAIEHDLHQHIARRIKQRRWLSIAASIVFVMGTVFWWQLYQEKTIPSINSVQRTTSYKPVSKNQAYLTLESGEKINLEQNQTELLNRKSSINIRKVANGELIYEVTDNLKDSVANNTGLTSYHTITTPRGSEFAIKLPDGTKVWLNAASSLRYPVHFSARDRKVKLTGEAYFDVSQIASSPFIVTVERSDDHPFSVEVLGTEFNINAYTEEQTLKTTLVSGKIRAGVQGNPKQMTLIPGQQAILKANQLGVKNVAVEDEIAWKSGNFAFHNTNLKEVMQQVARWYDLSVEYRGTPRKESFTGYISREVPVKDVLDMLAQGGGVSFSMSRGVIRVDFLNN